MTGCVSTRFLFTVLRCVASCWPYIIGLDGGAHHTWLTILWYIITWTCQKYWLLCSILSSKVKGSCLKFELNMFGLTNFSQWKRIILRVLCWANNTRPYWVVGTSYVVLVWYWLLLALVLQPNKAKIYQAPWDRDEVHYNKVLLYYPESPLF